MRYTINTTNYRDFDTLEVNREPARAYAVPYSSLDSLRQTPFSAERESSDLVQVLSGEWDFRYYADLSELPAVLDTDSAAFDKVHVPSTWQRTGYENPAYINCPYAFDERPPLLPEKMSCGVYRRFFTVTDTDKVHLLSFLGVIACIDLYINGAFVGYGEGAHNTSEFRIDPYIHEGENELVAVVHKWSTGTFLECQDMFRENGIFRDVLLYTLPQNYISDYELVTEKTADGYDLTIRTDVCGAGKVEALLVKDGAVFAKASANAGEAIELKGLDVSEWSAEIPNVFEVYLTLVADGKACMTLRQYAGFRHIDIVGHVFYFNGQKIKCKGVNHHDTHPTRGYALTFDDLEKDVRLMKQFNVNTVRTSHYPPDPRFLTLCDLYGLYVVDEMDVETHGCGCWPHENIDLISHDPKWIPRYLDRVKRMYMRDRSHPSVLMWSLGNEAGGYACQDACYAYLHEVCPAIPVHYEGVCRNDRVAYDVVSEMYTHDDVMRRIRDRKHEKKEYAEKPFFLCEYCHAMGVGPGALEEYWELFYSDDIFMGGCIWEWADHAVLHPDGRYTYGGDHGEWRHDGNFCVDGLFYPDRTPHTGAREMQAVYRPVRAEYVGGNLFCFTNTNRFRSSGYLTITCSMKIGGSEVWTKTLKPDIPPCGKLEVAFDLPQIDGDCLFDVVYTDSDAFVAAEQIVLREQIPAIPIGSGVTLDETPDTATFRFDGGELAFCKACGAWTDYTVGGKELLHADPVGGKGLRPNLYRALLDNDPAVQWKWLSARLHDMAVIPTGFTCGVEDGVGEAEATFSLEGGGCRIFDLTVRYVISGDGSLLVRASISPVGNQEAISDLARFGFALELPADMRDVTYYGRGIYENMPDFKVQSPIGLYDTDVASLQEPYIKPQDNGNHCDTRFVELRRADGTGVRVDAVDKAFCFNARPFTQKLLCGAKHREDLHDEGTTVLEIDGFVRGTGTASCGQDTLPQYRVDASRGLSFAFCISPIR